MVCFGHSDFEICFAPQQRALFRNSTSQTPKVVRTWCVLDILTWKCASRTTACTFPTSEPPKVARTCGVLYILTWKCASRHNGCALFQHPNLQKWREHVVFCTFWLGNVLRATTACTFSTSQLPKVVRPWCVLYILTWKCASRHNGVHFFDIATSKSGPTMVCFVHVDFKMCFAPQRRALFRHRNFQKWSAPLVFCPFWLGNVLRATTACTFSCLIWPAGSAPAALASLFFDPPEPQIIGTRRRMARERRGAGSSLVEYGDAILETIYESCVIGSREEEYQDKIVRSARQ